MSEAAERERLGSLVGERRRTLGMSLSEAARVAGINRGTWTGIEQRATASEDYTYGAVERVLRWAPGSIDAILAGGDPTPFDAPAVADDGTFLAPSGAPLGQAVDQWLRTIWDDPVFTDDNKRELEDRLRRMAAAYRAGEAEKQALEERMRYLQERHTA